VQDVFGAVKSLGEAVSTAALIWTERGRGSPDPLRRAPDPPMMGT